MRLHFYCLLICCLMGLQLGISTDRLSMEKLGFHDNYDAIVRDLIKNWESPIVYLRQLGYLPSDYEDTSKIKPSLDALMSRIENDDHRNALHSDVGKAKQQLCDHKKKKRRRKAELSQQNQKQHEPAAAGNQYVNSYPTVDHMLLMSGQAKPLAKMQEQAALPAEQSDVSKLQLLNQQKSVQGKSSNEDMIHRLLNKIRSNAEAQQLEPAGVPKTVANMPQYSIEPQQSMGVNAVLKLIHDNPGKSTADLLAISKANELKVNPTLSTYGTSITANPKNVTNSFRSSRPDQAKTEIKIDSDLEEPHYLSWDTQNNRLQLVSPAARDSYVDKLVQIFAKKQETLDILQNRAKADA